MSVFVFLPQPKYTCECNGPLVLPPDVVMVRPWVAATRFPERIKRLHADDCQWSDRELPLDPD